MFGNILLSFKWDESAYEQRRWKNSKITFYSVLTFFFLLLLLPSASFRISNSFLLFCSFPSKPAQRNAGSHEWPGLTYFHPIRGRSFLLSSLRPPLSHPCPPWSPVTLNLMCSGAGAKQIQMQGGGWRRPARESGKDWEEEEEGG